MRRTILFICIYLSIVNLNAQQLNISDSAIVSLITCSPGEEVYAKFGHTAIRINDPSTGIDVVFNYGMFSFETEGFYYKFIKGETDYQLGVYDFDVFLPEYAARNSMVWEQIINLTPVEKSTLIKSLLTNYEPNNRMYRYNFVFDNCSTRPRDKIISALNGYINIQTLSNQKSFRQWVGAYVGTDTWLKFGIDMIFGLDADKQASQYESMFLPEILMFEFQSAQIVSLDGQKRKLVERRNVLVNKTEQNDSTSFKLYKPLSISLILLVLGALITLWDTKRKRHLKFFDTILLISTGLAGCIAFYLMFFSVHPLVKGNLNLLWLNPLNVVAAILLWIKSLRKLLFYYQILNMTLLVAALFSFALSTQAFNVAAFPFIALLLMRSTRWFAYTKRTKNKNGELHLRKKRH